MRHHHLSTPVRFDSTVSDRSHNDGGRTGAKRNLPHEPGRLERSTDKASRIRIAARLAQYQKPYRKTLQGP